MKGAVLVAIAASIGNLLQGWDNATIAGLFTLVNVNPSISAIAFNAYFFFMLSIVLLYVSTADG